MKNSNNNKNKNPHQNLSEGGILEVCNLTYKLLLGGFLAEFRGLRVQGTHVTRRTRTTTKFLNANFFWIKVLLKLEFDTKDQVLSSCSVIVDFGGVLLVVLVLLVT